MKFIATPFELFPERSWRRYAAKTGESGERSPGFNCRSRQHVVESECAVATFGETMYRQGAKATVFSGTLSSI
jgi:hypothetical protein